MQLTIVSGTNRPDNLSLRVARGCQGWLQGMGIPSELLDLESLPREIAFDYLQSPPSTGFQPYQALVDRSSHFIFVAPEYNGSIPGILKVFIDACDYPDSFRGKSAALVGIAAGENGNSRGLEHLEDILRFFGMEVFSQKVTMGRIRQKLKREGGFHDGRVEEALRSMVMAYLDAYK